MIDTMTMYDSQQFDTIANPLIIENLWGAGPSRTWWIPILFTTQEPLPSFVLYDKNEGVLAFFHAQALPEALVPRILHKIARILRSHGLPVHTQYIST